MLNLGVGAINPYYLNRVGVEPNGDPVVFDPEKARKAKKTPIFVDFAPGVTPDQRKEIAKYIELRIKQEQLIAEILKNKGKIDPYHDKVYIDTKTGELTTIKPGLIQLEKDFDPTKNFKPGIYDPEQREKAEKRTKTLLGIAGALVAAGLGFLFGGKIKTGVVKAAEKLKPYVKNAIAQGKDMINKGKEAIKPYVNAVIEKGKKIFNKFAHKPAPVETAVK